MEVLVAAWSLSVVQLLLRFGVAAGQGYLEGEHRPLWILDDGLAKRQRQDRPEADYATTTRQPPLSLMRRQGRGGGQEPGPITFLVRHEERIMNGNPPPPSARRRMPSLPQRRFMMPHRLQLPHQYVQPNHQTRTSSSSSRSHRRAGGRHLPVFDNAPGENALRAGRDNYPIFVYNGTRGELILNTMLSRRRYPMQEPVPGQVLYPPSTPMFRPKPIVERFRLPGQREMLNLTLIPFYAHEAITNPGGGGGVATQAPSTTSPTPTPPYETQLPRSQEPLGKRKRKKAKQYEAFHSPQDVMQWQSVLRRSTGHDRDNHRHYSSEERQSQQEQQHKAFQTEQDEDEDEDQDHEEEEEEALAGQDWVTEQETETEMELPPEPEPETTTAANSGPFQIVYLDDSLERPVTGSSSSSTTTTTEPTLRQSSRYALKREYYAFPVYTLGKLLRPQPKKMLEKSDRAARSSSERGPNTWFILNSRYKGPHHRAALGTENPTKYYTSKYMESGFRPRR